ncbi:hypothetical protein [Schleiferia thermophila]|uniref:hypothetical protein n=1 Tax=Schleiferia thermophila TaxID=884107 RepID=UPI000FF91EBA|nr:hypothetical protein [Schleiferia thermophila]GCD79744.1 hypothetical protein JCM30197_09910 [Schleiferia thermophila]
MKLKTPALNPMKILQKNLRRDSCNGGVKFTFYEKAKAPERIKTYPPSEISKRTKKFRLELVGWR